MNVLDEWSFAVEAGKIAEFSRAVAGVPSDAAPPTFTMVAGAGMVERLVTETLKLDRGRTLHGEQGYEYLSPIRAGMTLTCRASLVSDVMKPGRTGPMRVMTMSVIYADAATGTDLVRETMTTIEKAASAAPPQPSPAAQGAGHPPEPSENPVLPPVTFGPVTRTDLVRYAGASGDFNPLHHDPDFARAAGLPDVMAHGMYSAGLVASQVERWLGAGAMARFLVRFRAPVWVGDALLLTCDRMEGADLDLTLRRGQDIVLSATVCLSRSDP
jgi:acyl dehydratase